jgi:hypothetical protein
MGAKRPQRYGAACCLSLKKEKEKKAQKKTDAKKFVAPRQILKVILKAPSKVLYFEAHGGEVRWMCPYEVQFSVKRQDLKPRSQRAIGKVSQISTPTPSLNKAVHRVVYTKIFLICLEASRVLRRVVSSSPQVQNRELRPPRGLAAARVMRLGGAWDCVRPL